MPYFNCSKSEKNKSHKKEEYDSYDVYLLTNNFSEVIDNLIYENEDYLNMFFEHAKNETSNAAFLWNKENLEENLYTYRNNIFEIIKQTPKQIVKKYKIFKYNKSKEFYANKIYLLHVPLQSEISVNLMWINKDKKSEVFPENYVRGGETINISERICAWAKLGYKVNFWYDSEKLSDPNSNIEYAKNKINTTCENYFNDIELKDVRILNYVNNTLLLAKFQCMHSQIYCA